MRYRILGPLEVRSAGGTTIRVPPGRATKVLALLLLNANHVVPTERLAREVWIDAEPPTTFSTQLAKAVSDLRKALATSDDENPISRAAGGYRMPVGKTELDLFAFRRWVDAARADRGADPFRALATYRRALDLWRGDSALEGISGPVVRADAQLVDEDRLHAAEQAFGLAIQLGKADEILDELRGFQHRHPTNERLCQLLLTALHRVGQRSAATVAYERYRHAIQTEHSAAPSPQLRKLSYAIARDDHDAVALSYPYRVRIGVRAAPQDRPEVPADLRLPPDIEDFIGRDEELAGAGAATGTLLVTGAPGVGKTAFAVRLAHRLRDRFPDGVWYLELRGMDRHPAEPGQVLERLLRAAGTPPEQVPAGHAERVAAYRRALADRYVLIVLDDAVDARQVRDLLLPPGPALALVTSQDELAGGDAPAGTRIPLTTLDTTMACELLRRVVARAGPQLTLDDELVHRVAQPCGGLPLALVIAAALYARYPGPALADLDGLVDRLGLEVMVDEVHDLPRVFAAALAGIDGFARVALRRLALLDLAPDFAPWLLAALLDTDEPTARMLATRLSERHLLEVRVAEASDPLRYRMHGLFRRYLRRQAAVHDPEPERLAAVHRAYATLLALAERAHRRAFGGDYDVVHSSASRHPPPPEAQALVDRDAAHWYQPERGNLRAAILHTADLGWSALSWDLAVSTHEFYGTTGLLDEWCETHTAALAACQRDGDERGEATMLTMLGQPTLAASPRDGVSGPDQLERAVQLYIGAGDAHGEAMARRTLASAYDRLGRFEPAMAELSRAEAVYQACQDWLGVWQCQRNRGTILLSLDRTEDAVNSLEVALATAGRSGHPSAGAQTEYWLGLARLADDDLDGAARCFRRVHRWGNEQHNRTAEAYGLHGLGELARHHHRTEDATRDLEAARRRAADTGNAALEGRTLVSLARLQRAGGHLEPAIRCLSAADARFRARGATYQRVQVLTELATLLRTAGRPAAAGAAADQAAALAAGAATEDAP